MLDEGSAALHPVAAVAIENAADLAQFGVVDVAADHTFDPAAASFVGNSVGKRADVLHGVLDAPLEIGRQRPIRISEPAPCGVEVAVEPKSSGVSAVAEQGQPAGVHDDGVERITMNH